MSKVLVTDTYLTNIANAIREKLGVTTTYTPAQMGPAIETITGGTVLVDNPDYFVAETIDTAQKIAALQNDHTFTALFVTDTHAYTSSNNMQYVDAQLASLNAVAKTVNPDLVIHGGDMTNGSEAKTATVGEMRHIIDQMREIGGTDTHILMGNHDGNTVQGSGVSQDVVEQQRVTESEFAAMCRSWDDGFTYAGNGYKGGNLYGYRDYPALGLRVIRLHSYRESIGNSDYNGGNGQNWGYYTDEQTWFANVALNTDNAVLIFCHQTLSPVLQGFSDEQDIPHGGTTMQQALDAWLAADADHRCAGVVHGHVHWDYSAKGKGTFTVINHETKAQFSRTGAYGDFYEHGQCLANYLPSSATTDSTPVSGYRDVPVDAILRGRTAGTVTQGLWTAVIVDVEAEKISLVRFGAGTDRAYGYGAAIYHSIATSLTHATISNAQTSIADGEGYTATISAASGYTLDSVTVTMGGVDITSTAYSNGTITIAAVTGNVTITAVASMPRTNMLPLATESDGTSIYPTVSHSGLTTVGYAEGYRIGSGGTESAASGKFVTGFIPVAKGNIVTFEGMSINGTAQDNNYIAFYDSSYRTLWSRYAYAWMAQTGNVLSPHTVDGGLVTSITLTGGTSGGTTYNFDNVAYMRVACNHIDANSAIYVE